MGDRERNTKGAQSVDRALALLLAIGTYGERGAPLAGLCADFGLSKPTCRRLLLSLLNVGLVDQDPKSRHYLLGSASYSLGNLASPRFSLMEHYRSAIVRIAERTGDTCILTMRQGDFCVVIARVEGTYPIRSHMVQPGQRIPLGAGAAGIAILSAMSDEEVVDLVVLNRETLNKQFPANTSSVIVKNVGNARRNGYSLNRGLLFEHAWGIGIPIISTTGQAIGAITVSAVDHRMTEAHISKLVAIMREEKERVSARLER
ncbi:IclR family transcriptional regulator [Frigidibacter oleivorans]|uniref:IclR family transcriptional regulator n=1 Tax=Frigidibacter oleivorans TaxID=2487129 RepID=UPI000F8EFFFF|nr:IclR family transcriptional regulator [Frigidibacter oleivorans]